jgi:hypothetical protein
LVAYVALYQNQSKVFESSPISATQELDAKSKALPLRFTVALATIPPGQYDCQITVLNATEQKATFWQAPVVVVP